jgi:pSer/pThr/pTyr-binding forkhead associated (FHA) protein
MPARLIALDGTADIPIGGLLTVVGRHRDCDARLDSSRVSRRHCCLALGGGEVLVRDLGSTNGVSINGLRVAEGRLLPGDVLSIAHLRFRLDLRSPDRPAAAPSPPEGQGPPDAGTSTDEPPDGEGIPTQPIRRP